MIHTGFTNANAMLHVANCVGNAGKIDRGESYKFYAEGVTPSVARLYEAINAERVAVAAALGASVPTLEDWFDRVYGVRGADLVETCQLLTTNSDGPYQATGTPKSFEHKYITEDVPVGLMPMSALGAAAGVPTPAIDALITLARTMAGKDFSAEARTLERMGLAGMDASQIRRFVDNGGRVDVVQLPSLGCTHSGPVSGPAASARQILHRRYPLPCADRSGRGDVPRRGSGGTPAARCVRQPAHARGQPAAVRTNRVQFTSVEKRLADMDVMGIDIQAITPAPNQTYYDTPPDLGIATARAINDNIAEIVARHPDRFVGLGTVPFQAPELAVAELDRLHRSLGLRGIEIATNVAGEDLSAERFRRIFAKAEELGLTIFMHPTGFHRGAALRRPLLHQCDRQSAGYHGGGASPDLWRRAGGVPESEAGAGAWRRLSAGLFGPHRPCRQRAARLLRTDPRDADRISEAAVFRRAGLHASAVGISRASSMAPTMC